MRTLLHTGLRAMILLLLFGITLIDNALAQQSGWNFRWAKHQGGIREITHPDIKQSGNKVYVGGITGSFNLPYTVGLGYQGGDDIYLACYDSTNGALIWGTYLGGNKGESWLRFIVEGNRLYFVSTSQGGYPSTHGNPFCTGPDDALVGCLDANTGAVLWTSYLGGCTDRDLGHDILLSGGRLLVGVFTKSLDYPLTDFSPIFYSPSEFGSGTNYALIMNSLDPVTGVLQWAAPNGMQWNPFDLFRTKMAVIGNQVITAVTTQFKDHPTTDASILSGPRDILLHSRNINTGALLWCKYLGGKSSENDYGLVAGSGMVFSIGFTESNDYPVTNSSVLDPEMKMSTVISAFNPLSGDMQWSSYYEFMGATLTIHTPSGNLILVGETDKKKFPVTIGPPHIPNTAVVANIKAEDGKINWLRSLSGRLMPPVFTSFTEPRNQYLGASNQKIYISGVSSMGFDVVGTTDGTAMTAPKTRSTLLQLDENSGVICMSSIFGGAVEEYQPVFALKDDQVFMANLVNSVGFPVTDSSTFSAVGTDVVISSMYPYHEYDTTNNISPESQEICLGGPLERLTGNRIQTQGCRPPQYQWQFSETGPTGPWADITGAITQNYTPSTSSGNRWYRRVAINPFYGDTISISNIAFVSISSLNAPVAEAGVNGYTCPFTPYPLGGHPPHQAEHLPINIIGISAFFWMTRPPPIPTPPSSPIRSSRWR